MGSKASGLHELYMKEALKEAKKAVRTGDIPVGAVIVKDGAIISRGRNKKELKNDPTLHAEIVAIRNASKKLKTWYLDGCDIYVTLEPCPMCAGALIQARVRNLFFGAYDPKAGAAGSVIDVFEKGKFNHNVEASGGILEAECSFLLKEFFRRLRGS